MQPNLSDGMEALNRMSCGTVRPRTGVMLVLAASLLFVTSNSWSLELAAVLKKTAVAPPARVGFREERHNRLLKDGLVLTGYLEYLGEGHLRKVVETPFRETFSIDGKRIEVSRDGKSRTIEAGRSKVLSTMLAGIEAILAGQADRLESVFRCTTSGTGDNWSLSLRPRSRQVLRHLNGLIVAGDSSSILSIRFELTDDEWHLLEILPDLPQHEAGVR